MMQDLVHLFEVCRYMRMDFLQSRQLPHKDVLLLTLCAVQTEET